MDQQFVHVALPIMHLNFSLEPAPPGTAPDLALFFLIVRSSSWHVGDKSIGPVAVRCRTIMLCDAVKAGQHIQPSNAAKAEAVEMASVADVQILN